MRGDWERCRMESSPPCDGQREWSRPPRRGHGHYHGSKLILYRHRHDKFGHHGSGKFGHHAHGRCGHHGFANFDHHGHGFGHHGHGKFGHHGPGRFGHHGPGRFGHHGPGKFGHHGHGRFENHDSQWPFGHRGHHHCHNGRPACRQEHGRSGPQEHTRCNEREFRTIEVIELDGNGIPCGNQTTARRGSI